MVFFLSKNHGANNKCYELCNPVGHVRATTKGTPILNDSERDFDLSPKKLQKDTCFHRCLSVILSKGGGLRGFGRKLATTWLQSQWDTGYLPKRVAEE